MTPGQTVYLGKARIEAVFLGIDSLGRASVLQSGRKINVSRDKLYASVRRKFVPGERWAFTIDGRELEGVVLSGGASPVLKVDCGDRVWHGCEVKRKYCKKLRRVA